MPPGSRVCLDNRESPNYFKTFYVRRICRIFPLYFLWLLGFACLFRRLPPTYQWIAEPHTPLWPYALYVNNFYGVLTHSGTAPYWLAGTFSRAIEEQFYLLLPGLVR
jgi:peptidoglycan/LPS O-acetylase OafA/YrhL